MIEMLGYTQLPLVRGSTVQRCYGCLGDNDDLNSEGEYGMYSEDGLRNVKTGNDDDGLGIYITLGIGHGSWIKERDRYNVYIPTYQHLYS
jgi:hypothetical protein